MPQLSRFVLASGVLAIALTLGGCATSGDPQTTGSLPATAVAEQAPIEQWASAYEKNPGDAQAALGYGRALRGRGQRAQALAVLQTGAARNPQNMPLLGEYGRALAENGQLAQALDVLSRAHTPDQPNWRVMLAQGAVLDQMGRGPEAVQLYQTALKIAPGEPELLNNLGLSYALASHLPDAETALRQACASSRADDRMRQNLALVLVLEGHIDEAQTISGQDLTPEQARQNLDMLRSLVGQRNAWAQLKALDRGGPAATRVASRTAVNVQRTVPQRATRVPGTTQDSVPQGSASQDGSSGNDFVLRPSSSPDSQPAAAAPAL